jgi:hypothetical protein
MIASLCFLWFTRNSNRAFSIRILAALTAIAGRRAAGVPDGSQAAETVKVRHAVCASRNLIEMLAGGGRAAETCNCPLSGRCCATSLSVFVFARRIGKLLGGGLGWRSHDAGRVIRPGQREGGLASGGGWAPSSGAIGLLWPVLNFVPTRGRRLSRVLWWEISEKTKDYANTQMDTAIEKFSVEFINECYVGSDGGRKNELRTGVRISLNMIANRIDRGFNFEVRIEPPKAASADGEVNKAVQAIQAASVNMQYMKLEGPPILALPEKTDSAAEKEMKEKRRPGTKKGEAK